MYILQKFFLKLIHLNNWFIIVVSFLFILFSSFFIYWIEPETFINPFEGFWWVMTTVTTVGYGDISPTTVSGKLFAIFLYIFGIGLIGVLIGKIVDWFSQFRAKREEGRIMYKGEKHIVIIQWSKKAAYAIEEILQSDSHTEVVIIDELEKAPVMHDRVHYVNGNATYEETLHKANVVKSKAVIIFANEMMANSALVDGKTLLIASTVERYAPDTHTTVEIMEEEHIRGFQHVKVDEFVLTHELVSTIAVRSAFTKGISTVYNQLLSRKIGSDLYRIPTNSSWKTYKDAFDSLLEQGATLIADRDKLNINQFLNEDIPEKAELYVICEKNVYESILKKFA